MNPAPSIKFNEYDRRCGVNVNRLPYWFRQELPGDAALQTVQLISASGVHTVCQEAKCPNITYCFNNKKATLLILGDTCTRNCKFCAVDKQSQRPEGHGLASDSQSQNRRLRLDPDEPRRIAEIVKKLALNYVVITSVSRDDLDDGGASIFARTIRLVRTIAEDIKIEALIPDFNGKIQSIEGVVSAGPDIIGHNIETVKRLYKDVRPMADYERSLDVLRVVKNMNTNLITKSSIMLGFGETEEEVEKTMQDLRECNCEILTLGQYLAPSLAHYPVKEFVNLGQFKRYEKIGYCLGFKAVLSGPKVRSSFQAEEVYEAIT